MVFHEFTRSFSEESISQTEWSQYKLSVGQPFLSYWVVVHSFHTFPLADSGVPTIFARLSLSYICHHSYQWYSGKILVHTVNWVYVSFDCTVFRSRWIKKGVLSSNIFVEKVSLNILFIVKVFQLYWLYTINKYHSFIPLVTLETVTPLAIQRTIEVSFRNENLFLLQVIYTDKCKNG